SPRWKSPVGAFGRAGLRLLVFFGALVKEVLTLVALGLAGALAVAADGAFSWVMLVSVAQWAALGAVALAKAAHCSCSRLRSSASQEDTTRSSSSGFRPDVTSGGRLLQRASAQACTYGTAQLALSSR